MMTVLSRSILLALFILLAISGFLLAEEPINDAVKPVPRHAGWLMRHNSINKRIANGSVDLIFIGDSITQDWEGSGKNIWERFYINRNAVNLGIAGDRLQHVIWRLDHDNIKNISPKAAVVMIGTNNSASNTPKEIAEGVAVIVKQLRNKLPKTQILLLAIFPRGLDKDDKQRQINEKANRIIMNLGEQSHVHYLDIGSKFLKDDGTVNKKIMPDLLHLNEKGYMIWAESIELTLKEIMDEK